MALRPRWYSNRAFQQGELDSLCPLYSIANSLRHCCDDGLLPDDQIDAVTENLLTYLDEEGLLLSTLIDGCGVRLFREMLVRAAEALAAEWSLHLRWQRPFVGKGPRFAKLEYLETLARHLRQHRASVIALVEYEGGVHWTVISKVTKSRLELRDSTGWAVLRATDIAFSPREVSKARVVFRPRSIFLVTLL